MSERKINPVLKQVLELGPTLAFFIIYQRLDERTFDIGGTAYSGFIVATLLFVPIMLVAMAILWALTGKLSRMQVFTAVMVIFFGGLTGYFNDERFFKMKTTIVYTFLAAILGFGLLRGRSYLEWVMGELIPMRTAGWMLLTRRITAFFIFLAVFNEILWRTQSTDVWVKVETFGFPALMMVFMVWQIMGLEPYMIQQDKDAEETDA
ncbi:intracellular septation protein [Loktanella sp. DSM 29012]|uniref:Inner membrane-spanning protein YciB n=1 Tax=Loktanella gaetbuli TaxID=2881335 RepID=A0ABS8BSB7_9RHOB|nr:MULTISPECIES: inner membrane-spanning protein YciB [Loktanella]MCB5198517.1 septation protein IspZ [Loktanella gaetbuli]SEQ57460.1 intracellular septation protein [Loktanella sp. DSM 29012]